ncbi:MAG: polymerase subunit gamma and tau [Myxococcaceae bacterium]|nr:polymerase subunit gamma and tau [Myxococcaceae bacterium]
MSYTVLARKYRPQTFADQVGQEHVTRTLSNAITSGRIAHAFLFTGVRGVGKTTSARLLAKALNCEQGPTPTPCNTCDACKQITAGVDLDVLEIDGASNNGVDDVRRLQESLPYRPARDRYKIVIVDEVHMLSTGAFNAFLKTLEEPPAHVKFIFATTEAHKVPVTIRSRCQHYSFRLIPQSVIADRVSYILAAEGIAADAQAIAIVAREAAGSMRDALTLLDQVIAFSGERLLGNEVALKLGLADREQLFRMAEAVLSGDAKLALEVVDAIASQGLDFGHFTRQWLDLMRDMVVLRVAGEKRELVELPEVERERASNTAKAHELLELERVFAGIAKLVDEVAKSSAPRLMLEMGAVRLATRPAMRELSELLARLSQLESGPQASAAPSSQAAPPSGAARPPAQPARPGGGFDAGPRPDTGQSGGSARSMGPAKDGAAKPNPFQRFVPPESSAGEAYGATVAALPPMAPIAQVTPIGQARAAAAVQQRDVPADVLAREAPPHAGERPVLQAAPPMRTPIPELWLSVIAELRAREPRWAAMFEHGIPQELSRERVVVAFQEGSFFGRQASSSGGVDALRTASAAALQAQPEVVVRFAAEVRGQSVAQREAAQLDERKEGIKKKALNHPRVLEALKVFPELAQKQDIQVD